MSRILATTGATGSTPSRLFYVRDTHTNTRFLVDTGSEVSASNRRRPTTLPRPTHSHRRKQHFHQHIRSTLPHPQPWSETLATVDFPHRGGTEANPRSRLTRPLRTHRRHAAIKTYRHNHPPMRTRHCFLQHLTQPLPLL